jgi:hypothetical protein
MSVDKEPDIIVAREVEDLATLVAELGGKHEGEVVVVRVSFIAQELVVDGEKSIVDIGEGLGALGRVFQHDGVRGTLVDPVDGSIPLIKASVALDGRRSVGQEGGAAVITEQRFEDASILSIHVLKVGVCNLKVSDSAC